MTTPDRPSIERPVSPAQGSFQRVVVAGTTGSGKTTLAREIAAISGVPHIELDALYWEPGWKEAEVDVFRSRVSAAIAAPTWVVDGNYGMVRDLTWGAADTLVWLDYAMPLVLRRLFVRSLRRGVRHEHLWNGNRERLSTQFLSRESLFLWALQTHHKHRRQYPEYLREPQYAHLRLVRLRRPRDAEAYVRALQAAQN